MRHVTLHDIAKRCKVSTATVSAVVNGAEWVSEKTRARVQRAVDEMGYHPNQFARGLKRREGHAVGVIVSDLTNPFFTQVVRSLSHALHEAGRAMSLCDSDHRHDLGEENLRMLVEGQIVGLVIIGDSVPENTLHAFMKHRGRVPVIAIEREYQLPGVSCLLVDSELGAYTATRHLVERGCERIAMITGPATGPGSATYGRAQRYDGYLRALAASGRAAEPELVVDGNFRYESGRAAMRRLLALNGRRPDAVFAANDMMALGAMSVIREAQLRVPDDVALVGFDNVPMTALMMPGLTTMAMPMSELGGAAARLLEQQLALAGRHQSERHIFSAELIVRDSSLRPVAALA
ncbi:MAG: LacI family transcriptional regulator [Gemmatimonadota bacterium]|nr:LacI family transcriptional regulator [Gemmatimonadota bacterium]